LSYGLDDVADDRWKKPLTSLYVSFFKTLTDQVITVELKNDVSITGTLKSVDQYVFAASAFRSLA